MSNSSNAPLDMKDKILLRALEDVPFDGWGMDNIRAAAIDVGCEQSLCDVLFPQGIDDVLMHFSNWADREMLKALDGIDIENLRIRDRIHSAVLERIKVLAPHKEAVRMSLAHWSLPFRQLKAGKITWKSADCIWNWAGDTATDYNFYTKRTLLSGVMASTILFWLNVKSDDLSPTEDFLSRRIENVMQIGKIMGKIKKANN